LDDLGLGNALRALVASVARDARIDVKPEIESGLPSLTPEQELVVYRVAQEALTNARKHAKTTRARVSLKRRGKNIRLEVRDFGDGFEPSALPEASSPGERVGISGMRERITLLGGDFELRSRPREGTSVVAEVPAKGADAGHASKASPTSK
jgi:signal transduction histidine kinase